MTAARTFAIIAACVAVLALAAQFSRRGPAAAQSSVPTQAELDGMLNPGPLTKARPAARPAEPGPLDFSAEDVRRASGAVERLIELDGIRDISQPHTVIVGNGFALAEYETKRGMLIQAMVVRQSRGLSTHFVLREPMNHREIGYFQDGRLQLK